MGPARASFSPIGFASQCLLESGRSPPDHVVTRQNPVRLNEKLIGRTQEVARGERRPISNAPLGRADSVDATGRPGAMPPADMPRPRWGEQSQTHLKNVQTPGALPQPFDTLRAGCGKVYPTV